MTEFLVRHFVKDYEAVEKSAVRTAYGVLASMVGIVCNVFLFLVKFIVGLLLHSVSVTADAFNNLSDAASSIISFIGVKMAGKPADKEHPFGHGRIEYIAALIVSFLVLEVGFTFLKDSVSKIRTPETLNFQLISVVILILSIGVKLWLGVFNKKLGKKIDSKVMMAVFTDSMGDVITTSATILSLVIFRLTGLNIDGIVGIGVALVVMWAGVGIAKDTLEPLIGEAIDPEEYDKVGEDVWIAKSANVFPSAYVHGPAIIGKDAEVRHCAFIRGNAIVGEGAVVGNSTELKNVVLFNKVQVPHYNYVGDSILGYKAHMGAGSITSNVKSDKKLVKVHTPEGDIETGIKKFGAMIGDNVEVGCGSVLNPGTVIGRESNIYPLSSVRGVVPSRSIYKKQGEVATKHED